MRFLLLDFVRGIAITLVLTAHVGQAIESPIGMFFGIQNFYYVSLGGIAVTIFLILSGIVLELNYASKEINFNRFITKRILRIQPVYYLSLIVGIVVFVGKQIFYTGDISKVFAIINAFDLIGTITGFYAFMGLWGGPFLQTSWFISLIITMYALYPIISKSMRQVPHSTIIILLTISTFTRFMIGKYELLAGRPLDWFPFCRVFEFAFGVYLVRVLKSTVWISLNKYEKIGPILGLVSGLSFPLFLVHYPILHIMMYFIQNGFSILLCILAFIFISILISWIIYNFDQRLPRQFVMDLFFRDTTIGLKGGKVTGLPKLFKK